MEFKDFKDKFQKNFKSLTADVDHLFVVDLGENGKDDIYNTYLDGFLNNPIFREQREFDCSCCKSFIRAVGNIVTIKGGIVTSIWDFDASDDNYQAMLNAMNSYITSKPVVDVFVNKERGIGTDKNFQQLENGDVITWHHFYLDIPAKFVDTSSKSVADKKGDYRDVRNVFKRSLDELDIDAIETILDIIYDNTLYKGAEWKTQLETFLELKQDYESLTEDKKELFAWEKSMEVGPVIGKIRNHSIGTLLIDISNGMDLDQAVRRYEKIVAPSNYKRPKAIFSKRQLKEAEDTVTELGYMESLPRRHATLRDININNILWSNKSAAKKMAGNIFEEMAEEIPIDSKKFSKANEISIKDFIENVVPRAEEIEVLFENKHASNLVSLIAPVNAESPSMFKWDNPFSWSYKGNITDSMKERVKAAGGNVEGELRFSIQWNDDVEHDRNDLDAHCIEPNGNKIFYRNKRQVHPSSGMLDVDITGPKKGVPAVENITYSSRQKMPKGIYLFLVHQFSNRGGTGGFRAEIEFDGQIYAFEYNKELKQDEKIPVAEVYFDGENFTIKELLKSQLSSKEVWNVKTNNFVPVTTIMYSPNFWDGQKGIGHQHYFFMLKDCLNDEKPNGFYNEFLKRELEENKRVFEALGSKMKVAKTDEQLSGLGFSTTKRSEITVKVKGQTERILKVKF